ncbi:arylamine N-acetyltransferase family protein [Trinickia diaoshuihuensis]|jgi:N-hydroxyarylamine O-acetyltransferase|uniref:arylamine N-acetyltransferase family protein n=1 Tax=Trinickia diaoshuihuensis TaxID=2292265 RepID=UPI000E266A52|nr:arylamine N-acetyltransferase [Trinickia diaoshuihuensis]
MHADNFSLAEYLDRIDFTGTPKADFDTVARMMRRQLFSVPFENLDVQAGKIVSLVPEEIVEKIVGRKRGGYCYEVNGLFAMALESLGIDYQFVAARPMFYPARRPRTHMGLVLSLGGERWLCDLGFGSYGIRAPMSLSALDVEVAQDDDTFKLSLGEDGFYLLQAKVDGQWTNQYAFDLSPQEWIDFAPANYLNSTHPDAIFVRMTVAVLMTETGRKILGGDSFKIVSHGRTEKRTVTSNELPEILAREFGLTMPSRG